MNFFSKYILISSAFFIPTISFGASPNTFAELVGVFINLINKIIPVVIALALLTFFYGILKFILSLSSNDKSDAKKAMFLGVVALFVMVSVWGLVNVVTQTFFNFGTGKTDVKRVNGTEVMDQPNGVINTLPPMEPRSVGTFFGNVADSMNFSNSNLSGNNRDGVLESGSNSFWKLWYNDQGQLDNIGFRQYNSGNYYTASDAASDINSFINRSQ